MSFRISVCLKSGPCWSEGPQRATPPDLTSCCCTARWESTVPEARDSPFLLQTTHGTCAPTVRWVCSVWSWGCVPFVWRHVPPLPALPSHSCCYCLRNPLPSVSTQVFDKLLATFKDVVPCIRLDLFDPDGQVVSEPQWQAVMAQLVSSLGNAFLVCDWFWSQPRRRNCSSAVGVSPSSHHHAGAAAFGSLCSMTSRNATSCTARAPPRGHNWSSILCSDSWCGNLMP